MECPHCYGLCSRISRDFREIQKRPEMMPIGITFDQYKMKEKTHDFQTLRMVFWFILLINIWIEEHFAALNMPPLFFLMVNFTENRVFLKLD
jgi:hypothetical protein